MKYIGKSSHRKQYHLLGLMIYLELYPELLLLRPFGLPIGVMVKRLFHLDSETASLFSVYNHALF